MIHKSQGSLALRKVVLSSGAHDSSSGAQERAARALGNLAIGLSSPGRFNIPTILCYFMLFYVCVYDYGFLTDFLKTFRPELDIVILLFWGFSFNQHHNVFQNTIINVLHVIHYHCPPPFIMMFSETTLYIITPRNTYFEAEVFDFLSNRFFSADHQFKDWLAFKE